MTILALDQSSKVSGYAVFKDNSLLTYGHFSFDEDNVGVRLHNIRNEIKSLIDNYKPDYVIFEDIQEQKNILTFKILAEVYGVVSELLTELHIPHSSVLASSWKSTLGIKGRAREEQKRNAQKYVIDTYGLTPTQDEADSICIGTHYIKNTQCAWAK